MNDLPSAFYTAKQLKEIDKLAVSQGEISGYQLMCRAAQAAFNVLKRIWPEVKQIAVFCGPGNNGGDGFVLARIARGEGLQVTVFEVANNNEKTAPPEATQARQDWLAQGEITPFDNQAIMAQVVVDALLGIGAHSPLSMPLQTAITAINQSQKPVFSLDIPSGLQADTGMPLEACVKASHTLTFIGMKLGLASGQGVEYVGELHFDSLGVSCEHYPTLSPVAFRLDSADLMEYLPHRHLTAHKGENGHVGIIGGGQTGYSGAVCLAGEAALRAGAGLVSAVVAPQSLPLLARGPAELMCYSDPKPKGLQFLFKRITVFVLGPGLSETPWGKEFFKAIIHLKATMVVDADGLNWLARYPQKRNNWILTPHPGEAARLLDTTVKKIQENRLESVRALHEKFGGVVVLKGAGTLIAGPEMEVFIQMGGFPVLATGGTGDVLAGLIGGLLAQGIEPFAAAKIAVNVHANAAELEESMGTRGMLASDLFLHIRSLLNPQESFP